MSAFAEHLPAHTTGAPDNPGGFRHLPALDGVRGLAILLVLVYHLLWANGRTGSPIFDILQELRGAAYCGVNLFFALSGFLITGILLDTLNVPHFFRTFYARRTLRIFPLYYGFLLGLLLLTRPLHFAWSGWEYYFLTYTSNLALWRWRVPLEIGFFNLNHFWSLQVEEQFYLVWPFVVFRVRRLESLVRLSLLACVAILGVRIFLMLMHEHAGFQNANLDYSPTFSCADNILFGCALAAALRSRWRERAIQLAPRILAGSATILLLAFIWNHGLDRLHGFFVPTLGFTLFGIAFTSMIAMALQEGSKTQRLFSSSPLRFLGRYSYGIYVFHYTLDSALSVRLRALFNSHLHSKSLSIGLGALIVAGLSVLIALISFHFFEVSFLRLKRNFSYTRPAGITPS